MHSMELPSGASAEAAVVVTAAAHKVARSSSHTLERSTLRRASFASNPISFSMATLHGSPNPDSVRELKRHFFFFASPNFTSAQNPLVSSAQVPNRPGSSRMSSACSLRFPNTALPHSGRSTDLFFFTDLDRHSITLSGFASAQYVLMSSSQTAMMPLSRRTSSASATCSWNTSAAHSSDSFFFLDFRHANGVFFLAAKSPPAPVATPLHTSASSTLHAFARAVLYLVMSLRAAEKKRFTSILQLLLPDSLDMSSKFPCKCWRRQVAARPKPGVTVLHNSVNAGPHLSSSEPTFTSSLDRDGANWSQGYCMRYPSINATAAFLSASLSFLLPASFPTSLPLSAGAVACFSFFGFPRGAGAGAGAT
mmetsp:Transcript_20823/g.42685  ORF Transcript_20823/g.42685 Transcript_20823/m.42685 type:complete len:365 (+) Transcript_20823:1477-2571(+)